MFSGYVYIFLAHFFFWMQINRQNCLNIFEVGPSLKASKLEASVIDFQSIPEHLCILWLLCFLKGVDSAMRCN